MATRKISGGWWVLAVLIALGADDHGTVPTGRWRVAERAWTWPTRLDEVEFRPAGASGDPIAVAYEREANGRERVWGSARIDRARPGPSGGPWMSAEWTSGQLTVLLQFRARPDGSLSALVRERPRDRASGTPELVRQVVLRPAGATDRPVGADLPVASPGAPRPGLPTAKSEPAGVFAVAPDGKGLRALAWPGNDFHRAAYPAWSPDGKWVAFTAFDPTGRDPLIRVVSASGGPSTAVAAGVTPSWSKDGSRIAYVASGKADYATDWNALGRNDERIEVVDILGPRAGQVEVIGRGLWPRWSPKEDRLAMVVRRDANWDVYVRSADGLDLLRRTDDPAMDTQPVWESDGRAIVFLSDRGNRWDLHQVAADGPATARQLTNHRRREDDATLSPDGLQVAFSGSRGRPEATVLVLDLASGEVRALLDGSQSDREPAWSPDGRSIAFVSKRPVPSLPPDR